MATSTEMIYSMDISGLHRRFNRFIFEILKSVSSNSSQTNQFDQARLMTYLNAIRSFQEWILSQPQLDLPETSPRAIQLSKNPEIGEIENESIVDVIRMLEIARDELINSQSARQPAGLISFDSERLTAMIDKIEAFLISYIAEVTPLDLPESSPLAAMTGVGHTGV